MRNVVPILIFLYILIPSGVGQQSPLYSQYVLNEFIINPAVAGIDGMTSINVTGRKQWLGFEFAPETYSVSVSARILKSMNPFIGRKNPGAGSIKKGASGRVGLGASVINDRNGAISRTTFNFSYAYHIPFHLTQLSFGASLLMNQFKIDEEYAVLRDPSDPAAGLIGASTYSPDAAFGIDYSSTKYHAGISIFNLFESPVKFGETSASYQQLKQSRQYYLLATYRDKFPDLKNWEYEGSIVARAAESFDGFAEISTRFIYDQEYWFGFSYRSTRDIIALLGMKFKRFYFGYSFDYGFSDLSRLSYGSHEINMAIKLGDSTRRYRWWERY